MYSRNNSSTRAIIDGRLFAAGTCKNVYKGRYIKGPRTGQECVAKEFKTGSVFADHYFNEELNVVQRTQSIINSWHAAGIIDSRIVLNTPEIWEYAHGGKKTLVEPFIQGFQKFNSNTGWAPVTNDVWAEAMQALSHFSYHSTGGQFLLCDLQGGSYQHGYRQHPHRPNHHVLELRLRPGGPRSEGYLFFLPETSLWTILQTTLDQASRDRWHAVPHGTRDHDDDRGDDQYNGQDDAYTVYEGNEDDAPSDVHEGEIE